MATKQLSYTAAQIDAAIAKINSLILHITANIVQLYDGSTAIYPRTQAEAVFFDGDPTKTLADYMWFIREGYVYEGIAYPSTIPNTPLGKIFYLTICDDGYVYERFLNNGVVLSVPKGISIISWDGSLWSATQLINIDNVPTENSNNLVKSKGVKQELENLGYYIDNSEFIRVYLDNEGKIVWAIQKDGNILFGAGVPSQIKAELSQLEQELKNDIEQSNKKIEELGYYIDNPEYLKLLLDSEGKILEGIKKEGLKYIPIPIKIDSYLETNSAIISSIQNLEYLKVETDLEGKIINAIKRDGDCIIGGVNINELKRELDVNVIHIEYDPETYTIYSTENSNSTITLEFNNQTGDIFAIFDNRTVFDVIMDEYGNIFIILK